jgi:hypothetical protein
MFSAKQTVNQSSIYSLSDMKINLANATHLLSHLEKQCVAYATGRNDAVTTELLAVLANVSSLARFMPKALTNDVSMANLLDPMTTLDGLTIKFESISEDISLLKDLMIFASREDKMGAGRLILASYSLLTSPTENVEVAERIAKMISQKFIAFCDLMISLSTNNGEQNGTKNTTQQGPPKWGIKV